jgi:hypothetical protein
VKRGGGDEATEEEDKSMFGFSKAFFTELFLPKEEMFQNNLFDLTVENNRFISYPFSFEDSQSQSKKQGKKEGKKS